jgi:uncharacterized protein
MEVQKHQPGNFCWTELGAKDTNAAKSFYGNLLGWTNFDVPGPGMVYTMFQKNGKDVAGLYELMPEQVSQGFPPAWLTYVCVESADNTTRRVQELGGTVILEPLDIPEAGRAAVYVDPQGATFGVWQPGKHIGAKIIGEEGAVCWNELATSDEKAAREFYKTLFRWDHEIMPNPKFEYIVFKNQEQSAGGMFQITPEMKGLPPSWFVYFAVGDCDETVQKAQSSGAKVMVPPEDIPNIGRFSILSDPQGAAFAVIKLVPM